MGKGWGKNEDPCSSSYRSLFDTSAQTAGQRCGADVAPLHDGEMPPDGAAVNHSGELTDLGYCQNLFPSGEFQNLLQVVPVCWVFYCITSNLTQKHRHTRTCV